MPLPQNPTVLLHSPGTITPSSLKRLLRIVLPISFQPGDFLGVFFEVEGELVCGSKIQWTGENVAIAAFGEDTETSGKDGFDVYDEFIWKEWRAGYFSEVELVAG